MNTTTATYLRFLASQQKSPETIKLRRFHLRHLTADLDAITARTHELEEWVHAQGWSPASVNAAIASLRSFYAWAVRYGQRLDNPAIDLRFMRIVNRPARIAADDVVVAALRVAPVDVQAMVLLGAECGLRRAEIACARQSDFADGWLTVEGKGGKVRSVHVPESIGALLPHLGGDWLFPGAHDGHVAPATVWSRIRRWVGVNPHALRHRAGTAVYRGTGSNLRLAQEFLGHSSPAMTARYVHVTRDDLLIAGEAARLAA